MTAPLQPAPGPSPEPGRRRLLTYGKTSRKRSHPASPISQTAVHGGEPVDEDQAAPAKMRSRPVPISQNSDAPSLSTSHRKSQGMNISPKLTPRPRDTRTQDRDRGLPSASVAAARTTADAVPSQGRVSTWVQSDEAGNNVSFAHRQKLSAAMDYTVEAVSETSLDFKPPAIKRTNSEVNHSPQMSPDNQNKKRPISATKPRRPRLIDALSAQRPASPEPDAKQTDNASEPLQSNHSFTPGKSRLIADRDTRPRQDHRSRDTPKRRKVKYTYSQSRTFIGDSQSSRGMETGESDPALLDSLLSETEKPASPGAFDFPDDDEDDATSKTAIRSVHELRRAGAHNRIADEMEDLMFRIGTPNCDNLTMRRNALLELASKLEGTEFNNQFRNHAARDNIVKNIGQEEDPICAFALAASLVIFLASGPAPNLLRQMAEDHVGTFASRMLRVQEDVESLSSRRTLNLSRSTRVSVKNVEQLLVKMDVWHGYDIATLSPRDIGLQLVEMFFRVSEPHHLEMVADELESDLTVLAEHYSQSSVNEDVGVALIVSIFEAQSSVSSLSGGPTKILRLVPLVAKLLPRALREWSESRNKQESHVLKLAINLTNTESGAAAFDDRLVLSDLANCINKGVLALHDNKDEQRMPKFTYEGLLRILGIAINIMEHCAHARRSISGNAIDTLTSLYLKSRLYTGEVCL
jgi:hypothetical protein